jgi:hypothetical protein
MIDPIAVGLSLVFFVVGFVIGANWRLSGRYRRAPLPLPHEHR